MYKHLSLQAVKTGGLALSRIGLGGLGLIWIARELGPSEYGKVSFVFAFVNFLAIPFYGALNNFLVRETAHTVLTRQSSQICALKSFAYRMHLIAWVYTIVVLVICLTLQTSLDHRLFSIAVFLIPFICLVSMQAGLLRGQGHVVNAQSLEWFWQPALYVFFLAVVIFYERLESLEVVWAALAAYVCASLLGIYRIRTILPDFFLVSFQKFPNAWLVVWGRLIFVMGLGVANTNTATLFLGSLSSSAEVGYLGAAENVAMLVSVPLSIINTVIAAPIAQAARENNKHQLQLLSQKSSRVAFAVTIPVAVAIVLFGRPIISLLFGESYVSAYQPLVILLLGHLINVACGSVGLILTMSGNEKDCLQTLMIALAINVVLCIVLIGQWGSVGAAMAAATSMIVWNLIMYWRVRQRLGIRPSIL